MTVVAVSTPSAFHPQALDQFSPLREVRTAVPVPTFMFRALWALRTAAKPSS